MSAAPAPALDLDLVQDLDQAAALLHPTRLRVLEGLAEPDSAAGLARRLGLPRQQVNYHLRELEKRQLIEQVDQRRKGNCIERIVRATARSYLIAPQALGRLAARPEAIRDRLSSAYLVAVAARAIRDLAVLRQRAAAVRKELPTFTLQTEVRFATAADRTAFADELANEVARLTAKYHDEKTPKGRRYSFFIGGYPTITKTPAQARREAAEAAARRTEHSSDPTQEKPS